MNLNILPVFRRDLKAYFHSPSVYVVAGLFLMFAGFVFMNLVNVFSYASVSQKARTIYEFHDLNITQDVFGRLFYLLDFLILLMVPIITMRTFAEEQKTGTFELLMTCPLRNWDIILGKYLACVTIMAAILGACLIFPFTLVILDTPPEFPVIFSAFFGLLLIAGAYVAFGVFASSLTENQLVASVITLVGLFLFLLIGDLSATGLLSTILEALSVESHTTNFTIGIIALIDVVYFVLFAAFFLFLTARVVQLRRWRV